jgi:hypothetical protein
MQLNCPEIFINIFLNAYIFYKLPNLYAHHKESEYLCSPLNIRLTKMILNNERTANGKYLQRSLIICHR